MKNTKYVIRGLCVLLLLVFIYNFFENRNSTPKKSKYDSLMDVAVEKWKTNKPDSTNEIPKKSLTSKDENIPLGVLDKISAWKKASFDQRFSLCIAMAVQLNKDLKGEKLTARDIHNCIEEATRGLDEANNLTIIQVASLCVSKLKQ